MILCSDVRVADAITCHASDYLCASGKCISASIVCDGFTDCANNEDEETVFCGIFW